MKKFIYSALIILISLKSFSQNVAINTSGTSADVSAMLDVSSTTKGILVPRVTSVQRTAISSPANGLLVFDISTNSFWFFSTTWKELIGGATGDDKWIKNADSIYTSSLSSRVGIGTTTPAAKLEVKGGDALIDGITVGTGGSNYPINTAVGFEALKKNTGINNTAVGHGALSDNTSGNNNTAMGLWALTYNTTGTDNTSVGRDALYGNTTGENNTAMGYFSLWNNTTGSSNTAIGQESLQDNTIGYSNVAVGVHALDGNTQGHNMVAIGDSALSHQYISPDDVYQNTAIGSKTLFANTTGSSNTGTGFHALYHTKIGFSNTALGTYSLNTNQNGNRNTAVGDSALFNVTTSNNTAVGYQALKSITTGSNNTAIGYNAYPISGTLNNYTGIGYNVGTINSVSNSVEIGNSSVTWIGGQVGWSQYSDGRIKKNITEDVPGLSFINKLRPVTYNIDLDKEEMTLHGTDKPTKDFVERRDIEKKKFTGFVAQEVAKASTETGYEFSGVTVPKSNDQLYSITYSEFVVPLVKAVQELSKQNDEMKKQIEELKLLLKK